MSDEREKELEAHLQRIERTQFTRATRAGYDAREPELDRLRADLVAAKRKLSDEQDNGSMLRTDLATSQERVGELEAQERNAGKLAVFQLERAIVAEAAIAERDARIAELETSRDTFLAGHVAELQTRAETAEAKCVELEKRYGNINAHAEASRLYGQREAKRAETAESELTEARRVIEAVREAAGYVPEYPALGFETGLTREELLACSLEELREEYEAMQAGTRRVSALLAPPTTEET